MNISGVCPEHENSIANAKNTRHIPFFQFKCVPLASKRHYKLLKIKIKISKLFQQLVYQRHEKNYCFSQVLYEAAGFFAALRCLDFRSFKRLTVFTVTQS